MLLGSFGSKETRNMDGWVKASASTTGMCCVMAKAISDDIVLLADSKNRRRAGYVPHFEPVIMISAQGWDEVGAEAAEIWGPEPGETIHHAEVTVQGRHDGSVAVTSNADRTTLIYLPEEWKAYLFGVKDGEMASAQLVDA